MGIWIADDLMDSADSLAALHRDDLRRGVDGHRLIPLRRSGDAEQADVPNRPRSAIVELARESACSLDK
jgi:hypothetical protein